MKNKKNVIISIIAIILLIIIIIFIKQRNLNTESNLVQEIYSYLGNNDLQVCNGLVNYDSKSVSYKDLSIENKICIAYSLLNEDELTTMKIDKTKKNNICSVSDDFKFATDNYEDDICTITKVDAEKVNKQYEKMYGEKIADYAKFQYDDTTICYYYDGNYYCGLAETYTYTVGAEPHTYRSIEKAIKNKDEIIIYDYFLKIVNNECYENYIDDTKNEKCSKAYEKDNKIDYKYLKKYGTLYKHTFKKDDKNYYWTKSEPI